MAGEDNHKQGAPTPAQTGQGADLDLEKQIEELASAMDFDLDDEPLPGDELSDEGIELGFDGSTPAADATAAEPAAPTESEPLESEALELDEFDFVEVDGPDVGDHLDEEDDEPDEVPAPVRPLFVEVDGAVAKVDQDRFVIGRVSKMCDLAIIDVNVSRQHCAIERRDGEYFMFDLGSTNGVLLDGQRVNDHRIQEGDTFVLSSHRVRATFTAPSDTAPQPIVPVEPRGPARLPAVTGRMQAVPIESSSEPAAPIAERLAQPAPRLTAAHIEPAPAPVASPAAQAPVPTTGTFEERVEMRLQALSEQVTVMQQQVQAMLGQMQQLQAVAGLAQIIQQRLNQRQGG